MTQILTLDEMADVFSEGIPRWQREANYAWVERMHTTLKEGGILGVPNTQQFFQKTLYTHMVTSS